MNATIDITLDDGFFEKLAEQLEADPSLAEKIAEQLDLDSLADSIDKTDIADNIADNLDYRKLAGYLDASDIADEIDATEQFASADELQAERTRMGRLEAKARMIHEEMCSLRDAIARIDTSIHTAWAKLRLLEKPKESLRARFRRWVRNRKIR